MSDVMVNGVARKTRAEWRLNCSDCALDTVSTRKPVVGAFHWSIDGKCESKPHLSVRHVTSWQPSD